MYMASQHESVVYQGATVFMSFFWYWATTENELLLNIYLCETTATATQFSTGTCKVSLP